MGATRRTLPGAEGQKWWDELNFLCRSRQEGEWPAKLRRQTLQIGEGIYTGL